MSSQINKRIRDLYLIFKDCKTKTNFWMTRTMLRLKYKKLGAPEGNIPMWSRLAIEIQSDCNRDCYFCPRHGDYSGIRKDMDGKHIKKNMPTWKVLDIIDQAWRLNYKGSLGFHRLSEPFLDERYLYFASYAKSKGMTIEEDTNGDLLKNNKDLCSELDGLLSRIRIGLYDYKNIKEKKEQMGFWKNLFKKTKVWFSLAAEFPLIRINSGISSSYERVDKKNSIRIKNYPCIWPMIGLFIRYDGEVSLCCEDDQCVFGLGNVFNSSIENIWRSKKHINIINTLMLPDGRSEFPLCKICSFIGFFPYWRIG